MTDVKISIIKNRDKCNLIKTCLQSTNIIIYISAFMIPNQNNMYMHRSIVIVYKKIRLAEIKWDKYI